MRVAIPIWNGRVSPVFDVSRRLRVFDIAANSAAIEAMRTVEAERPTAIVTGLGVDLLICSAISLAEESALRKSHVEVISGICGPVEEIAAALAAGDVALTRFRAPGCGSR
jgi:predicted Fe-Mo cluster-binding NifX family protein